MSNEFLSKLTLSTPRDDLVLQFLVTLLFIVAVLHQNFKPSYVGVCGFSNMLYAHADRHGAMVFRSRLKLHNFPRALASASASYLSQGFGFETSGVASDLTTG